MSGFNKIRIYFIIAILLFINSSGFTQYRFIISSDFPPFPVTNSDPDDVQSSVSFAFF